MKPEYRKETVQDVFRLTFPEGSVEADYVARLPRSEFKRLHLDGVQWGDLDHNAAIVCLVRQAIIEAARVA